MNHSTLSARFRAIRELQVRRDKHPYGSKRFDELDHAIDLALNARRNVDGFLVRNALRDAERIVRRQRRHGRVVLHADLPVDEDNKVSFTLADALTDIDSPEEVLSASNLLLHAAEFGEGADSATPVILASLIEGRTTRETAAALNISRAHAFTLSNRTRSTVRALVEA